MAAERQTGDSGSSAATIERHRFTIAEFEQMATFGLFGPEARVELIAGEVVDMAAKGDAHVRALMRSIRLITPHVTGDLWLAVQDPVRIDARTQPEPDLLVCRLTEDGPTGVPGVANTLLVLEVADSSLPYDRGTKVPLYGRAGIPETWLIDLVNGVVERYSEPGPAGYRLIAVARHGESLISTVLPGLTIEVDLLLA
jgi:Uma2 family endonuclease